MNLKIYAILGVLLLGLSGGLYLSLSALFTARSELKATNAKLNNAIASNRLLEAFTADLQKQVQKASVDARLTRQGIEYVLQEESWSDDSTPSAVVDELCKHLTCIQAPAR